ncbi:unnamed protein product [Parascedosporium putredinis]|uniref:Shikimate dehydrogenase substrate binding N-terminal domain-containing protein n=1 Tax=Parascedosporium putredinis TaxID=1442378 RepID=A0A9P1MCA0_9PEZI|nr:unnamed protein product [Parascedosporium putredinis]CAI8000243.1 unnamed protein product [Parascedosporium putredinis]
MDTGVKRTPSVARDNTVAGKDMEKVLSRVSTHALVTTTTAAPPTTTTIATAVGKRSEEQQTEGIDDSVNTLMRRPDFGGASVTFPHKLQVGKLLDTLTPVARKVGAVNTVIVREEGGKRTLLGDNTDWLGIKACIESTGVTNLSSSTVLILGAGGAARAACHAVEMLGIKDLIIVNRTISKADDLASIFPNLRTRTFESFDGVFSSNGPRYRS